MDNYLGGADTLPLYQSELEQTIRLAQSAKFPEATRRGLLSVVAEQAQQAGWASFDAGLRDEAERLYKFAMSAATEAGSVDLQANSLAFIAYMYGGTPSRAVEFAQASCNTLNDEIPGSVHALMNERLAWAYARNGDAVSVERSLDTAKTALMSNDNGELLPDWSAWVDERELSIMAGRCWAELGRPLRAVSLLEDALGDFDDSHARDKSLYLTWLAKAYLDAREVEQSAHVLNKAMTLTDGVGSVRPRERIRDVAQYLAPFSGLSQVGAVLERIAIEA